MRHVACINFLSLSLKDVFSGLLILINALIIWWKYFEYWINLCQLHFKLNFNENFDNLVNLFVKNWFEFDLKTRATNHKLPKNHNGHHRNQLVQLHNTENLNLGFKSNFEIQIDCLYIENKALLIIEAKQ